MTQPLIILGMHRSGTSMLTRILAANGLFVGHRLSQHSESLFFHALNVLMLRATNAEWDNPEPALHMMSDRARVEDLAHAIQTRPRGLRSWNYLGSQSWRAGFRIGPHLAFPWGWKDPRTSLFLPVWLKLFPEAKLLRLRRHGIDVAASIVERELRRDKAGHCNSVANALQLWVTYEIALDAVMQHIPAAQQMTIRFEDYAQNYVPVQAQIDAFAGLNQTAPLPSELMPRADRVFAYRENSALRAEAARHADLLRAGGYEP